MQRSIQHQGLDFVQWPDHGLDCVSAELFESGDAFVTIDDQVAIRLIGNRDNDDRRLLSCSCQRRQQLSLPLGIPHPQVFMTAVQLVKLQLHAWDPHTRTVPRAGSGIAPRKGEVCRKALPNQ